MTHVFLCSWTIRPEDVIAAALAFPHLRFVAAPLERRSWLQPNVQRAYYGGYYILIGKTDVPGPGAETIFREDGDRMCLEMKNGTAEEVMLAEEWRHLHVILEKNEGLRGKLSAPLKSLCAVG